MTTPNAASAAAQQHAAAGDAFAGLVRWASSVRFSDLPADVRERALLVLADDLAAMIAVAEDPQVRGVQDGLITAGQAPEATVFGAGRRRGERAAVAAANGTAGDWAEMDEGYRVVVCHAGIYVLPALLAEAEYADLTVEQLLAALVAAYEVVTRTARAWRHDELLIHPHALLAPVGASAGAAFGAGLSPEHAIAAVSGGASTSMLGPFDHALTGELARNVWTGIAAWTGVQMARWAPLGIEGEPTAPNSAYAVAMGATPHLEELSEGLGSEWAIRDGYHKLFACCQYAHSTVEALLELREELQAAGGIDVISAIEVHTHPRAMKLQNASPATSLAAKFSLPHAAAASLVFGQIDAAACGPEAIDDPRVVRLRELIAMTDFLPAPAPPHDRPARVVVTLTNGQTLERTCMSAIGSPDRPLPLETLLGEKILGATSAHHPGFVPTIRRLLTQPEFLQRSWRHTLDDLLEG